MQMLRRVLLDALSLLAPVGCAACGAALEATTGASVLSGSMCKGCQTALVAHGGPLVGRNTLSAALLNTGLYADVVALCYHKRDPARQLVRAGKYHHRPDAMRALGRYWGELLAAHPNFQPPDALLPVPLHTRRLRTRGYNQSDALAHGLSVGLGVPVLGHVLLRTRATATQTALQRAARAQNVQGAFTCLHPADVQGRHLFVVDDVLTTGATLGACATALHAAGVARLTAAALALA